MTPQRWNGLTVGIVMVLVGISLQETYAFTCPKYVGSLTSTSTNRFGNQESLLLSDNDDGWNCLPQLSTVASSKRSLTILNASSGDNHDNPKNRFQIAMSEMNNRLKNNIVSMRRFKHKLSMAFAIFTLCISTMFSLPNDVLASSGGRMGGSFKSSSRSYSSSPSRSYSSSPSRSYSSSPSQRYRSYSGNTRLYGRSYSKGAPVLVSPSRSVTIVAAPSPIVGYVVPVALYGSIVYFNNRNRKDSDFFNGESSALGPGVSVVSLSVGLDVRDRDDPSSILARLKRLSQDSDTQSRSGVQNLVSEVCLELIRQQINMFAASTSYQHFSNEADASRAFNMLSIKERSKFERETVNKFGGVDRAASLEEVTENEDGPSSSSSTSAIVTILLSIEGNKTKPRERMSSWQDVWDGIHIICADAKVEDCLLSAEVLWTPEDRADVLTRRDIAADYPDLRVI